MKSLALIMFIFAAILAVILVIFEYGGESVTTKSLSNGNGWNLIIALFVASIAATLLAKE